MSIKTDTEEFGKLLGNMGIVVVLGLAKLLGVEILAPETPPEIIEIEDNVEDAAAKDEHKKPELPPMREGGAIVEDMINAYMALNRKDRRRVLGIMRANQKVKK